MEWRFDGRGRWTAESAHLRKGAKRPPTYIINVTGDGEFACTSNDLNVVPDDSPRVPTLTEAKRQCEELEREMLRKKR